MPTDSIEYTDELPPRLYWVGAILVLILAAFLRFSALELRPLHHDEGVNHFFLNNLLKDGVYRYDPTNYHGPTLYFISQPLAAWAKAHGQMSATILRVIPAAFGLGLVALVFALGRRLGQMGSLLAAALLALSPGMCFISRYYIHEMILVCATLGLVVCLTVFYDDPVKPNPGTHPLAVLLPALLAVAAVLGGVYHNAGATPAMRGILVAACMLLGAAAWKYDGPRAFPVVVGGIFAALMFATKETTFITIGTLLIAAAMAWVYPRLFPRPATAGRSRRSGKPRETVPRPGAELREALEERGGRRLLVMAVCGLAVFLVVYCLYYSSFFTNAKGLADSLEAFKVWSKTGHRDHAHPVYEHLLWLWKMEAPQLLLGILGIGVAVYARERWPAFIALWAFGITLAYSLIPYKTPWLLPNFILPLALIGGWGVARLPWIAPKLLIIVLALGLNAYQTYRMNFVDYDRPDPINYYVYGHTTRQIFPMLESIFDYVHQRGLGTNARIYVASPDHWPLPFYFRDFEGVGYYGKVGDQIPSDVVVLRKDQEAEFIQKFGPEFIKIHDEIQLRPGVQLIVYARR